ncbi:MAG: hypothetical protein ACYCT2_04745 [Thermoplasmataceae archaeon]
MSEFWQRRKEKKFARSERLIREDSRRTFDRAKALAGADEEARRRILAYSSWRATVRKALPQILVGCTLAYVEYSLIGLPYTAGSMAAYVPLMYLYTKSVRPHRGRYLLEVSIHKGSTAITRYVIPEELWDLIEFDHPLVPGMIRFNGRDTFLATRTWKIEGTNLIYKVKLAWLHFNQLEYARNREILEKALSFATNLSLENAELDKMKGFLSIMEGKRQKKEQLDLVDRAYRENPLLLKKRIEELEVKIDDMVRKNESLLFGPDESEGEDLKDE